MANMKYNKNIVRGSGGGGKGGGGAGRPAQEDADTLHSSQSARVLDAISEGEIHGLANGEKGIYLDSTPLMAPDGSYNFENVTTSLFEGTQSQDYMPGFGGVEASSQVGLTIKKDRDTCPPQVIHQSDLDAVRVTIACMTLTKQDKENGDLHGSKVEFDIYIKYSPTDSWVKKVAGVFDGKTTKKYTRSYRIDLDKSYGSEVWIKVERLTDKPEDSSEQNEIQFESYTKIIDNKLAYPNTAYVGLAVNAKQFQSIPKRAYDIKGIKVKLPSNYNAYDPDTLAVGDNLYEGHWDGQLNKVGWTSNPAWILYDLVTNTRYGLGDFIRGTQIDKWTLYQVARYCDAVDLDGNFVGVKSGFKDTAGADIYEPRFAMNLYIQQQQEAIKVVQDLAFAFRGLVYWAAGQLVPVQDSPKKSTKLFSSANVIDGSFQYTGTAQKARKTVALVSWNDPEDMYRSKVEYVEDREGIERYGIRKTEITSFGCTSRGQAHRIGLWSLFTDRLETELLAFKTGIEAAQLRPGDLISVADPTRAGKRMGGRIKITEGSSNTRIYPDVPFTPTGGVDYTLNVVHTEDACLYPQETSPGVPHPNAGQLYTPDNPRGYNLREACIADGGQWSPYLFNESYTVDPTPYVETEYLDIPTESRIATAGTGEAATPHSIWDSSANFTDRYLNRRVENITTGATSTITQIISATEVHVADTGFAVSGDTIKYIHALSYEPKADFMYLLEEIDTVEAQEWRVVGVAESKKNEFAVSCMEYQGDKYRIIEENLNFEELDSKNVSSIPNILSATPPPEDIDIAETLYLSSDGTIKNKMVISWDTPADFPYIRDYLVQYKASGGNWVTAGTTEFNTIDVLDMPAGDYTVRIRATSVLLGKVSTFARGTKTLEGLTRPPASITQYCEGYSYARTSTECLAQGACSTTNGSLTINDQAVCESKVPLDPNTGLAIATQSICETDLGHYWDASTGTCRGLWVSDGNTWVTNANNFVAINDFELGTSLRWEPIADLDLSFYELQRGASWVSSDSVTSIDVISGGTGYSVGDPIVITSTSGGAGATAKVKAVDGTGAILSLVDVDKNPTGTTVTAGGTGYSVSTTTASAVTTGVPAVFEIDADNLGCCKCRCAGNDLLVRENLLSFGIDGGYYLSTGTHKFMVKAVDNSKVYSNYTGEVTVVVTAPDPITGLSYSFAGTDVLLSWTPPASSFYKIDEYDIRYGSTWTSGYTDRVHTSSSNISINVTWGGTRKYWVAPEDKGNNYGAPVSIDIAVVNPDWSTNTVSHNLTSAGSAVLSWTIPDIGSLPISNYEIRYGGTSGDTATLIGTIKTTTHSETVTWGPTNSEPVRKFWIRAIDSAGNTSPWQSHDVEIRDPIDLKTLAYTLVGPDQVIDWTSQGAGDMDYDNNADYLLPVNYWEVKRGDVYGSAAMLSPMKSSPRYSEKVDWGNGEFRRYWITPIDSAGNRGNNHSIDIVINNPAIPPNVNYSISGNTATVTWTAPSADLDIVEYELRSGSNWSTKLDGSANVAITKALTLNHTLNVDWRPYDPANNIDDTRFFVRAIDSAGNYSEEPIHSVHTEGSGWVLAEIEKLGQVQSLNKSFVGIMVLLTWTAPTHAGDAANNYLPVDFYEIRDSAGIILKTTNSTSYSTPVTWSSDNPRTFTVVAKDTGGNYGDATNISVDVPKPDTVTGFNITVVDNNVLMKWNDATNTAKLDIDNYVIKRCPDTNPTCSSSTESEWNSLVSISSTKGLFVTHLETIGGVFKYWIRAKDTAGNLGDAVSSAANVSEPPDFVLQDEKVSTLDDSSAAAMKSYPSEITEIDTTNMKKGPYFATLPVNLTETWASHFTTNGFASPQAQISAGHEYYLEPTLNSATLWQKWDLETELDASSIQIIPTYRNLKGTTSVSHTIYYMKESDASTYTSESISDTAVWTAVSGASTVSTHEFRFVKVKTVFTTDGGGNDLTALDEYKVKFSLKLITDAGTESITSGSGLCNATASEDGAPYYWTDAHGVYGTVGAVLQFDNEQTKCTTQGGNWYSTKNGLKVVRVFFAKDFKDIRSLNMNYAGELTGPPRIDRKTIFDFEDAPNPSYFYGFILDTDDGTGQEGKFSWTARGVQ